MTAQTSSPRVQRIARTIAVATIVVSAVTLGLQATSQDRSGRASGTAPAGALPASGTVPTDFREFTTWIVNDISSYWEGVYGAGGTFVRPELVFFVEPIDACGETSTPEGGPFYCNNVVYVPDAWFAADPALRLDDFAVAYVMAHEIAHDVQDTQGILSSLNSGIITSVQTELQADCLAGVWAHSLDQRGMLEDGDLAEARDLAYTLGDDYLGYSPEEFDHGSSEQRLAWFDYGFAVGNGASCTTY